MLFLWCETFNNFLCWRWRPVYRLPCYRYWIYEGKKMCSIKIIFPMFHEELTGNLKVLAYVLLWSKVIHNKTTILCSLLGSKSCYAYEIWLNYVFTMVAYCHRCNAIKNDSLHFVLGRAEFGWEKSKFNKGEQSAILKLRSWTTVWKATVVSLVAINKSAWAGSELLKMVNPGTTCGCCQNRIMFCTFHVALYVGNTMARNWE